MDDPRTRAALDSLADLFLTGTAPATGLPRAADMVRDGGAALDGPRPIRLAPKLRAAPAAVRGGIESATIHPLHRGPDAQAHAATTLAGRGGLVMPAPTSASATPTAAASMLHGAGAGFRLRQAAAEAQNVVDQSCPGLSEEDADEARAGGEPTGGGLVEAVFLGNLPGFSGPWLTQYARFLANGPGPVAVLRLDSEQVTLELVSTPKPPLPQDLGEEDAEQPVTVEGWAGLAAREGNLIELLDGLADFEGTPVRRWVVNFGQSATPTAMAMAGDLPRWSFLCGADQAAVVGAYRLLKQLIEADEGRAQREVGFMIMGSDEAASHGIVDRLNAAAAGFLRQPLEFVGSLKQMAPVSLHIVGSFPNTATLWDELVAFFQDQAGMAEVLADEPEPAGIAGEIGAAGGAGLDEEEDDDLAFPTASAPTIATEARRNASLDFDALPNNIEATGEMAMSDPLKPAALHQAPPAPEPRATPAWPAVSAAASRPAAAETLRLAAAKPAPAKVAPAQAPTAQAAIAKPAESQTAPMSSPAPFTASAPPSALPMAPAPAGPAWSEPLAPSVPPIAAQAAQAPASPAPAAPIPADDGPDLAQYVAGGALLEARCPRHPQTRLVLDEQGVLHLLRRHGSARMLGVRRDGAATDTAAETLRAAVVDLIEARAWVNENLALLKMTQRQFNFDVAAEPVLHLFTDQAKPATALVAQLGTFIRIHILQEVRVGGTLSWYCAELN